MDHCDAALLLKNSNIRATAKKRALLEEIIGSENPRSASDLHLSLSALFPLDLVTVYRSLTTMRDAGILREITDASGVQHYEMACVHNPLHPHFSCAKCKSLSCLRSLSGGEEQLLSGFASDCDVDGISVILSGVCSECREGEEL